MLGRPLGSLCMTQQPTLFERPYRGLPGFAKDSATSAAAAASLAPSAVTLRAKVYAIIARALDGLTADEVAAAMGQDTPFVVAPRITELYLQGRLRKSEVTRTTRRGRQAAVYHAKGNH